MNSHLERYLAWLDGKVGAENRHLKKAYQFYARFKKTGDVQLGWQAWKCIHQAVAEVGRPKGVRR